MKKIYLVAGRFSHARDFAAKNRFCDWNYVSNADQLRGVDRGQTVIVLPCAKTNDQFDNIMKMAISREFVIKRGSL